MNDELALRIAQALERHVQQEDEAVERMLKMRAENIHMRDENISRDQITNMKFLARLDHVILITEETRRRVETLEAARTADAVDPHVGSTPG